MLSKLAERLKQAENIAIFTHLNPDGDALGSAFAMKYVLEAMGKRAVLWLEQEMPEKFHFLGTDYSVGGEDTKIDADVALVLDCAAFSRLGRLAEPCRTVPCILCVDHHYSGEDFGEVCYKVPDAAATAQVVYDLVCLLTEEIPLAACEAMYTGLSTDTGHFKFSNVTPKTHAVAAKLLERGINHGRITQILYDTVKQEKLIFLGKAAERIEFFADGKIAMLRCPESFLAEYDLSYDDVEELPNLANRIDGVLASVLVKDRDETSKRVSLRGKDVLDLSCCASEFGGGGHKNAAAFVAEGDIEASLNKLITILEKGLVEQHV